MNRRFLAAIRVAAVLFVGVLLQTTVGADLRIKGVAPDLMLLLAVCGGLAGGPEYGAMVGFAAGLLTDVFLTDTPVGLAALTFCLVGFVVGSLRASVIPEGWALTPLIAVLATAGGVVLFVVVGDVVGQSQLTATGSHWLIRVAIVESVFAGVLSVPVARLVDWAATGSLGAEQLGKTGGDGEAQW